MNNIVDNECLRPQGLERPRQHLPLYIHRPREPERLRYPLSPAEIEEYHENGILIIRNVFSQQEIDDLRAAEEEFLSRSELLDPDNMRFEWMTLDGQKTPWKIDPFIDVHPLFGHISRDRRICDRLCSLYDGYEPRIFKDKYIRKPSGGHGAGKHQDYHMYQGFPPSILSVVIAIDSADRSNGCTQFWPGSHKHGLLHQVGSTKSAIPAEYTEKDPIFLETNVGDIAIFSAFTIHAAEPNTSDRMRRQIFLTYNDARHGEHYFAHREHFWSHRCNRFRDRENDLYML